MTFQGRSKDKSPVVSKVSSGVVVLALWRSGYQTAAIMHRTKGPEKTDNRTRDLAYLLVSLTL